MNVEQAKRILLAYRLGEDACPGTDLDRALSMAQQDPDLAAWMEQELECDQLIRERLRSVQPPADLRESLLRAGLPSLARLPHPQTRLILAAAAAICLLALGAWWFSSRDSRGRPALDLGRFQEEIVTFLGEGRYDLQVRSDKIEDIRRFLRSRGVAEIQLPDPLSNRRTYGCQVLQWEGHEVVLICFRTGEVGIAHLVIVPDSAFTNPPGSRPEMRRFGQWTVASWSREGSAFAFCSMADEAALRKFLGA
jgi:hypothetical protein